MPLLSRRNFLLAAAGAGVGLVGLRFAFPWMQRPGPLRAPSGEAAAFAAECFRGLDRSLMWDTHVHVVGLGSGGTGCWINPAMQSHLHPIQRLKFDVYRSAVGMGARETADADYVERLFALHRLANPAGKLLLLAFDVFVDEQGQERPEHSPFFTPNEYVLRLARENDDALACASVHPYRVDAVERLDRAAAEGARAVKWLPNSMGIDPASPRCDAFYRRLAELGLPLITHGGKEYAVDGGAGQAFGNPLRLRRPLDAGVCVVVAHCASFGDAEDLDAPADQRREMRAFELLLRLLDEKQYERTLYADISALNQLNRSGHALREMIVASEYHPRLLNGSDFPLPSLGFLFSTRKLQLEGYLDNRERRLCNAIHDANPLLFDFAVKRTLKVERNNRTHHLSPTIFQTAPFFEKGDIPI